MQTDSELETVPIPKLPLIEISADVRVLIENHNGIIAYDTNEICVKVSYGTVCICGSELDLARMTGEQLVITGTIECVSLMNGRV